MGTSPVVAGISRPVSFLGYRLAHRGLARAQALPAYRCPGLASLAHRDLARTQLTRHMLPTQRCPGLGPHTSNPAFAIQALPAYKCPGLASLAHRDLARTQVTRLLPFGVACSQVSRLCLGLHTSNRLSLLRCYPLTGVPASTTQALPSVMLHMFVMFSYVIAYRA